MSTNSIENLMMNNSQLKSKISKYSQQSQSQTHIASTNNNSDEENNKLYEFTLEMAINYDLILPSKEKDFSYLEKDTIFIQNSPYEIKTGYQIDKKKLNEIMKILSKYND